MTTTSHKGTILLVDDRLENLRILTVMLTEHGYKVQPAVNGQLALKTAHKFPPDLILLDILMPDMEGYEVCKRLKTGERTRDIPIIFISALGETQDKVKAFAAGGVDYVTKPFQVEEVMARVETHLTLRRVQKQIEQQNTRLEQEITKRKQVETALRKRTYELKERVKELNCLYGVFALAEKPGISLEEIFEGTVKLIPPAWQYPEIACARLILRDQEFNTDNFKETPWKQGSDILMYGNQIGILEVYYLEEKPASEEGPFLKRERTLLKAVAERLGEITERMVAEKELRRYYNRLEELVEESINKLQQKIIEHRQTQAVLKGRE